MLFFLLCIDKIENFSVTRSSDFLKCGYLISGVAVVNTSQPAFTEPFSCFILHDDVLDFKKVAGVNSRSKSRRTELASSSTITLSTFVYE